VCPNGSDKFDIQDQQYSFPYHYIPHFDDNGAVSLSRKLDWGMEYLCYQGHLREMVIALKPSSVLEVGCGDGYFVGGLPDSISVRVGVDLSEKAIAFAKAFHQECEFRVQNVALMDESFDVVAAIEVIEHISNEILPMFLRSLSQRVSDEGVVIISVPTTVTPLNKKHYRHYTLEILTKQLESSGCGLRVKSYEYIYARPWWFPLFKILFDNRLFSLEIKPFMKFAWAQVWNKYRFASEVNGFHLVVVLGK
jgi:SAM-dependent methyltransferase